MAAALGRGMASRLRNSLQATPAVTREQVQAFATLLEELRRPEVGEAEASRRLREWMATAPKHAVSVLQAAALSSRYTRAIPPDSWLLKALGAERRP